MPAKVTRRRLLGSATVGALLSGLPMPADAFLVGRVGSGSGGGGGASLVATHTVVNSSASAATNQAYVFGQPFRRGDIPSGFIPQITDHLGNALVWQMDEGSYWPDGSLKHAAFTVWTGNTAGTFPASGTEQLQINKVAGTYSPTSSATLSMVSARQFQQLFTDARLFSGSVLGSGSFTWDVNSAIADGIVQQVSIGPVRCTWIVYGAALDASPTTTTLGAGIGTATGSILVGSTASFPASGTYIVKIDSEYALGTTVDATHINLTTRGACRSSTATHASGATVTFVGHFWVQHYFDVYTNPNNPGVVFDIAHIPLTMQPWMNVVSPDIAIYKAKLVDGASTIRDWATSWTVTSVTTGASGTLTLTDNTLQRSECVLVSSTGALPGGITANTPYWLRPTAGNSYSLHTTPPGASQNASTVNITDVGSGTITVTRYIGHAYRAGWFSAADDEGNENWMNGLMPTILPQLTTTEKLYWTETGLVPPYETTLIPNILGASSNYDTILYRPLCAIGISNSMGVAGDPPHVGPLSQWQAIAFMRQDSTSLNFCRTAGLGNAHIADACTLQEATGYIQPNNNGANRTGGAYAQLGAPQPTWSFGSVVNGITTPLTASAANGVFQSVPSGDHWHTASYYPFLVLGKRWFLDTQFMDASMAILISPWFGFLSGKTWTFTQSGTAYHAKMLFEGTERGPARMNSVAFGASMGAAANPERGYLFDVLSENWDFYAEWKTYQTPGLSGYMDIQSGITGFVGTWAAWAFIWGMVLTRDSRTTALVQAAADIFAAKWGETWGLSSYYAPYEYTSDIKFPSTIETTPTVGSSGTFIVNWCPWSSTGISTCLRVGSASFSVTASSNVVTLAGDSGLLPGFLVQEGDLFKCMTPFGGVGSLSGNHPYSGPAELDPVGVQEWFYIRNPSASDGFITFNLSATPTGALITFAASSANNTYVIRPQATPPTSSGVVDNASWNGGGISYTKLYLGTMNWMKSAGITTLTTALANCNARIQQTDAQNQANPKYDMVPVTIL